MVRSRKTLLMVMGTLIVSAGMILGTAALAPSSVALAQAPTPTPNTPAAGSTTTSTTVQKYWDFFWNTFAQALNVSESKVKSAFVTAVDSTVDQAVNDGLISSTVGDNIKTRLGTLITQGPTASGSLPLLGRGLTFGFKGGHGRAFGIQVSLGPAEFAKALNMTQQALTTELQAGKSIDAIAKEHNIDPATVKSTVLADLKTQLNAAVASKTITQAQADQIYSNASSKLDTLMSSTWMSKPNQNGTPNNNNGSSGNSRFGGGRFSGNGL